MNRLKLAFTAMLTALALTGGAAQSQSAEAGATTPLHAYFTVRPYPGSFDQAVTEIESGRATTVIPLSTLKFTASKDGRTYSDVIVGQSPKASGLATTHVNVMIVPLIIDIGATAFNPTVGNNCGGSLGHTDVANLLASPVLSNVAFDGAATAGHAATVNGVIMGTGTYIDEHRRAEFLKYIGGAASPYHTVFNVTQWSGGAITIPASKTSGHSTIVTGSGCSLLGALEYNWFDSYIQSTILPKVGATPNTFVIMVMHDVVMYDTTTSNCCILGYHGTLANKQTYTPLDYDTTGDFGTGIVNVSVATHEVAEWLDDPLGSNPTPAWGKIGQVSGCQSNWEVGDPLTGMDYPAIKMANGVTYNLQETAFWGWYYSKDHDANFNIGAGGDYSMHATFKGPSKACPPGGTFPN